MGLKKDKDILVLDNLLASGFLKQTLSDQTGSFPYTVQCKKGISLIHHDIGVLEVRPVDSNKSIVISSGIHGDETAPLELINDIVNEIVEQHLCPTARILFIIAHPCAIKANKRFIDEDLNRCFAGHNLENNDECKIANKLQQYVSNFFSNTPKSNKKWHLDLHSAIRDSLYPIFGVVPGSTKKMDIRPLISFANAGKIGAMMLNKIPSSTFSWWTANTFSALSVTIEMGRVNPLYQNNMKDFFFLKVAIQALLSDLVFPSVTDKDNVPIYQVSSNITKVDNSFRFYFPAHTANFSFFPEGKVLAEENGVMYIADKGGEVVIFPNANVVIGQRACLLAKPISPDLSFSLYVNDNVDLYPANQSSIPCHKS